MVHTALHDAAKEGDSEKLQLLLSEGTYNVNETDNKKNGV
jgi:hypothetical protein